MFRQDAIKARQLTWLGEIVLIRPVSFTFLTAISAALSILIVLFFFYATYTKRSAVSGQLVPDLGLIKVYSPQPGIVLKRYVSEGQFVSAGEPLFLLTSDRQQTSEGNTQEAVSKLVRSRQESLAQELEKIVSYISKTSTFLRRRLKAY